MYSVVGHHSYSRSDRRQNRQQNQQQQQQQQQQSQQPLTNHGSSQQIQGSNSSTFSVCSRKRNNRYRHRESLTFRLLNYIRKRFNPIAEEDPDELNIHVCRYKPEELSKLTRITKFNKKEIQLIYRGFKQECPSGLVDEDSFKTIFAQFFPLGDATQYAQYVFNTIKRSQQGKISFEDFLAILSKVSRGSIQEKLHWIFGLYDLNKDGLITKDEMVDVVNSIYEMLGRNTKPQVDDETAVEHVDRIFHLMDRNQDGVVTIEELIEWCLSDERIMRSLDTLNTIL